MTFFCFSILNSSGLKNTIFIQNFNIIDWISDESAGFLAFNIAICITNFVAAGSHLNNRSVTHVSFYRQVQTSWLNMFKQFAWVVVWVKFLFCWSYKFYLSIIIVGTGFTSTNASKENNNIESSFNSFMKVKPSTYWKWNSSRWRGSCREGEADIKQNVQYY